MSKMSNQIDKTIFPSLHQSRVGRNSFYYFYCFPKWGQSAQSAKAGWYASLFPRLLASLFIVIALLNYPVSLIAQSSSSNRSQQFEEAMQLLQKKETKKGVTTLKKLAQDKFAKKPDSIFIVACEELRYLYFRQLNDIKQATKYNHYLKEAGESLNRPELLLSHYNFQHILFYYQNDLLKSLSCLEEMERIYQTVATLESAVVQRYAYKAQLAKANLFLKIDANDLAQKTLYDYLDNPSYAPIDPVKLLPIYGNLATTFRKTHPDSVICYGNKTINLCGANFSSFCKIAHVLLAYAHAQNGNLSTGKTLLENHIDLDTSITINNNINTLKAASLYTAGYIYARTDQVEKAKIVLQQSRKIANHIKDFSTLEDILSELMHLAEKESDFPLALKYSKEKEVVVQQVAAKKWDNQLIIYDMQKLFATKDQQIATLQQENQTIHLYSNQLDHIVKFLGILLFIGSIGAFAYAQHNRIEKHKLNEAISLANIQSLTTNMNPHFLFNAFNTLQNFILKEEKLAANEYLMKLSGLIRSLLINTEKVMLPLDKELRILQDYVDLEKKRFEHKIEFNLRMDKELSKLNPSIPTMVIQPHLENAILHGLQPLKKGIIELSLKKEENYMVCTVKDNGIGREKAKRNKNKNHLAIASTNTAKRLEILKRMGYHKSNLDIQDLTDEQGKAMGTEVIIILPFMKGRKIV